MSAATEKRRMELQPIAAFLPMVCIAWADGELDAEEIRAVHAAAVAAAPDGSESTDSVRRLLDRWLDPDQPPNAFELALLLDGLELAVQEAGLGTSERLDLAGLGFAIAEASEGVNPFEREALEAVQAALGVDGTEAARQLLASGRPAAEPFSTPPSFDIEALKSWLDEPNSETREKVRELLQRDAFRVPAEPTRAEYRQRVFEWLGLLADEGVGALSFPREHGGAGDTAAFVAAFETLALGDLSLLIKFGVQFGLFGSSIHQLGTESHHQRYLPSVGTAELPGCFAMTETGHGSNVADIETTARYQPLTETFVVDTPHGGAMKNYIGNAACHGRLATVFVQLEVGGAAYGVHAILVPIRDQNGAALPGVTIEDDGPKLGLNGVDNGRLGFDSVEVPRENLLDRFAQVSAAGEYTSEIASPAARFFTMLGTLVGGRVSVATAGNVSAKKALWTAVRYANRRRQFGPPDMPEFTLLDYLSHQERLLPRVATTYALHFGLRQLAQDYVAAAGQDGENRELETKAAALKAFATWHCTDTVQECREACGGQGYLVENGFARLKADSDIFTTFEGDNTVLMQLVAKGLLTDYRNQFSSMSLRRMASYVGSRMSDELRERTPRLHRPSEPEALRSRAFQAGLFEVREQDLLSSLGRRLKSLMDRGNDSSSAILEVQDHMIELGQAYTERLVFSEFCTAIDQAPASSREVLELLRALFAMSRLERDRGWFLEHGVLEARTTKAIRSETNALLRELRPQAENLVNAWNLPADLVNAAIAG